MKEVIIEKRIINLSSSYLDFFDPEVEGGFWDLFWFLIKSFLFCFVFSFVFTFLINSYALVFTKKMMLLSNQCQIELSNIINDK